MSEVKKGKSVRLVSGQFGVPKSTDTWKGTKRRCIIRDTNYEKLYQACHVWFLQQRSKGAPVSGLVLREKAMQLFALRYPDLSVDSFKASSGWLHIQILSQTWN